jgi:hypothetical protein
VTATQFFWTDTHHVEHQYTGITPVATVVGEDGLQHDYLVTDTAQWLKTVCVTEPSA